MAASSSASEILSGHVDEILPRIGHEVLWCFFDSLAMRICNNDAHHLIHLKDGWVRIRKSQHYPCWLTVQIAFTASIILHRLWTKGLWDASMLTTWVEKSPKQRKTWIRNIKSDVPAKTETFRGNTDNQSVYRMWVKYTSYGRWSEDLYSLQLSLDLKHWVFSCSRVLLQGIEDLGPHWSRESCCLQEKRIFPIFFLGNKKKRKIVKVNSRADQNAMPKVLSTPWK